MPDALQANAPAMPSFGSVLLRLWPNGDEKIPGLRAGMIASAPAVFARYGITTPLLVAHAMAQFSHECGAGHDVVENLSYSAQRLIEVWPKHFNAGNAAQYAHNPRQLGNYIYNPPQHTDLGNRSLSDDGSTYRGRGGSQCTGRDGYARLAKATGLDLLNNPGLINTPENFLLCAVADFVACGCLPYAKADDVVGVSAMLNVGHLVGPDKIIGLSERKVWLARWKTALGSAPIVLVPAPQPSAPKPAPPAAPRPPAPAPKAAPAPQGFFALVAALFAAIFKRKG